MVSFDPRLYNWSCQEWDATKTPWGKCGLVLFYSFVWIQIIGTIWSVFNPTEGWDCLYGALGSQKVVDFMAGSMKVANVWILGFMVMAERGRFQFWNVFRVWLFYLLQYVMYKPYFTDFLQDTCSSELRAFNVTLIITQIWITLALIGSFLEARSSLETRTGREESTPLVG